MHPVQEQWPSNHEVSSVVSHQHMHIDWHQLCLPLNTQVGMVPCSLTSFTSFSINAYLLICLAPARTHLVHYICQPSSYLHVEGRDPNSLGADAMTSILSTWGTHHSYSTSPCHPSIVNLTQMVHPTYLHTYLQTREHPAHLHNYPQIRVLPLHPCIPIYLQIRVLPYIPA